MKTINSLRARQAFEKASIDGYSLFQVSFPNSNCIEEASKIILDLGSAIGNLSMRESTEGVTLIRPNPLSGTFSSRIGHAPLHTDSSYRLNPERWVLLVCLHPSAIGGETILVSAKEIHTKLEQKPDYLRLLSSPLWSFVGPSIFGQPAVHYTPVISTSMIRWRPDCTSPSIKSHDVGNSKLFDVLNWFNELVLSCQTYVLKLNSGDAILINNWSMLHGRNYFDDPDRLLVRSRIW
jgi:alpha-ketoglutarate-dependent taurine dioxygenase